MSEEFTPVIDYYRNHTALKVRNLQASLQFYHEVMGLPIILWVGPQDNPRTVFLAGIQLYPTPPAMEGNPVGSFDHFGLCVDNLEAACSRLDAAGFLAETPIEHRDLPGTGRSVTLAMYRDPDGNRVELFRLE